MLTHKNICDDFIITKQKTSFNLIVKKGNPRKEMETLESGVQQNFDALCYMVPFSKDSNIVSLNI